MPDPHSQSIIAYPQLFFKAIQAAVLNAANSVQTSYKQGVAVWTLGKATHINLKAQQGAGRRCKHIPGANPAPKRDAAP